MNSIGLTCGLLVECSWWIAGYLFELPAEVLHILIAASRSDFGNALGAMNQILFRDSNPAVDDIIHAGNSEGFLVDALEVAGTDSQIIRHFGNCPVIAGIVLNGRAKSQ